MGSIEIVCDILERCARKHSVGFVECVDNFCFVMRKENRRVSRIFSSPALALVRRFSRDSKKGKFDARAFHRERSCVGNHTVYSHAQLYSNDDAKTLLLKGPTPTHSHDGGSNQIYIFFLRDLRKERFAPMGGAVEKEKKRKLVIFILRLIFSPSTPA